LILLSNATIMTNLKCSIFCAIMTICLSTHAMRQAVGHYTGNGAATRTITGLGFQPEVVLVKPASSSTGFIATSTMTAGKAKLLSTTDAPIANYVNSLDANGFTAGSLANSNGVVYYYVTLDNADGDVTVGTYTGSTSPQTVNVGYRPAMVWVLGEANAWPDYGNISMNGWDSAPDAFTGPYYIDATSEVMSSYTATGFSVPASTSSGVVNGVKYNYVAIKGANDYVGTYTGTGSALSVNLGIRPDWVVIKNITEPNNIIFFKDYDMPANTSYPFTAAGSSIDVIGLSSTGFTVGTDGAVNTPSDTYEYFALSTTTGTLPVELLSFKGTEEEGASILSWQTTSEINSSYFELDRSADGIDFTSVGQVNAAGSSSSLLNYSFKDENPLSGINYYRLKSVDKNESYKFSETIAIDMGKGSNSVSLYPNPVYDLLELKSDGSFSNIKILNTEGQTLFETNIQKTSTHIDVSPLSQGIYLLRFQNGDNFQTLKFVKQ